MQRSDLDPRQFDTTSWLCLARGIGLDGLTMRLSAPVSRLQREPMLATLLPVVGLRLILDLVPVVPILIVVLVTTP